MGKIVKINKRIAISMKGEYDRPDVKLTANRKQCISHFMEKIGPYNLIDTLDETGRSLVYRARENGAGRTVIIKLLKAERATPTDRARFRQEYSVIKGLDIPGIVKTLDIISRDDAIAIVLEDFDGISLKRCVADEPVDIAFFLSAATIIAGTLGQLHRKNIIHGDIKPRNIIVNREKGIVKITDFGIARAITHDNEDLHDRGVVEGTLAYLSPEQTGRMNRIVDYRSDIYSLGVSCYEILAGTVPFPSTDPMEVIHSHIARMPAPPDSINPAVPQVVSRIVMKLLAKSPEERYQNCFVLQSDLDECRRRFAQGHGIDEFEIAENDIALSFNIPHPFIGRGPEMERLRNAFGNARKNACIFYLVSGPPGIGKSALINELQVHTAEMKGYYASGKHDQYSRDVPYRAVAQALSAFLSQVLAESKERINVWKEAVNSEIGNVGRIIADIIPNVELITGPLPEVPELGPQEAQNRFYFAFKRFIIAITGIAPIALFLDDLQWADAASLGLIKSIAIDNEIKNLLLIGAYRDAEPGGPLALMLDTIEKIVPVEKISLTPLESGHVNELLALQLKSEPNDTGNLAEIVHAKTGGNPFFVHQFIRSLYDSGLLILATNARGRPSWEWDIEKIRNVPVTENIIDLMSLILLQMPEETLRVLEIASCIGSEFDLEVLARAWGHTNEETLAHLSHALDLGLIAYSGGAYRFYHDKILEAAHSRISVYDRNRFHDSIGSIMLDECHGRRLHERIISITDHLNFGLFLDKSRDQKVRLAELNLMAGKRAGDSVAYAASLNYFKTGIGLIESASGKQGCWNDSYALAFDLHVAAAEAAYFLGHYDIMDGYNKEALAHAKSVIDEARVCEVTIESYKARRMFLEAVKAGVEVLAKLGVRLPISPSIPQILFALFKTRLMLRGLDMENLLGRPVADDPRIITISRIVASVGSASMYTAPKMLPLLAELTGKLYINHGYTPESPYGLAGLAIIVCNLMGDLDRGLMIGKLAMRLLEKHKNLRSRSRTYYAYYYFIHHNREHMREDNRAVARGVPLRPGIR